jgi:glyoxylase-like metal-dependent hydrolase (beta-lactamase superfamily II)
MTADPVLEQAERQIRAAIADCGVRPVVECFFDEATHTASYLVHDPGARRAAIIDSVLDYDAASGRLSTASADAIIERVEARGLQVDWILETHVHADHLSAAQHLRDRLGGLIGIGREVARVQARLGPLFDLEGDKFAEDAGFDRLFEDGARFEVGGVRAAVLHVPGHTPADVAYVIGPALFVGDTLFMPDSGTARADFPGGDARQLYRSIRRLLALPGETPMYLCHDYKAPGRDRFVWQTTVAEQNEANIHVRSGVGEDEFAAMRSSRDATLAMPGLMLPSLQVNLQAGRLPGPARNGTRYLQIPLNVI